MPELLYQIDQRLSWGKTWVFALQWVAFATGQMLVVPVVVGSALGLNSWEMAGLAQRLFLLIGVGSLLQTSMGHRLPIVEGSSGVWWVAIISLATSAVASGVPLAELRPQVEFGIIAAGILTIIVGISRISTLLLRIFTPPVLGTVLVLQALQLSGTLVKGALLGGDATKGGSLFVSLAVIGFIISMSLWGGRRWRGIVVLLGVALGWAGHIALGYWDTYYFIRATQEIVWFRIPQFLAWGMPRPEAGVVVVSLFTGLIVVMYATATMTAMLDALKQDKRERGLRRGIVVNGVANILAGLGAITGVHPHITSVGLINITGIGARIPFVAFRLLFILVGFVPAIGMILATIPSQIANAVTLALMATVLGTGIQNYSKMVLDIRDHFVLGISLMLGTGMAAIPPETLRAMPALLRPILSNGMIVGTLSCIVLDRLIVRKNVTATETSENRIVG